MLTQVELEKKGDASSSGRFRTAVLGIGVSGCKSWLTTESDCSQLMCAKRFVRKVFK